MPRIIREITSRPPPVFDELVRRLQNELTAGRESGQPFIEERQADSGETRSVNVFWDEWDGISEEDRIAVIRQAYENAFGPEFADQIVLVAGYSMPEGRDFGLLRYAVVSGLRSTDTFGVEDCRDALIAEGASILEDPNRPELRFPTLDDAIAAVNRLDERLPGSRDVWIIAEDVRRVSLDSD